MKGLKFARFDYNSNGAFRTLYEMYKVYCRELEPYNSMLTGQTDIDIRKYLKSYTSKRVDIRFPVYEDIVVGFIITEDFPWGIYIHELYVSKHSRRKGIAKEIVKRYAGNEEVGLFILGKNDVAKAFWKKMYDEYGESYTCFEIGEGAEYRCKLK